MCAGTISSRARADLAKQFREELEAKQREMDKLVKFTHIHRCTYHYSYLGRLLKRNTPVAKGTDNNNPGESPPQNRRVVKKRSSSLPATVVNRRSISFRLSVPHATDKKECEEVMLHSTCT